ncbi:MAG TPA: ABC transporter ATP-binding protein [Gemmatimonadales bacterium]|nr:ABC transporter ATP-binding protein [Gemmatimonadales bacterium]
MAIAVSGVWKRYRLRSRSLKELLSNMLPQRNTARPPRPKTMWALEDVSFEVKPSSTFALVGPNGSGKSTMLKLIAGMMKPTRGSIQVAGRLSLLSFLGGSFHGDLTGRENVFLEGALLGLSRSELKAKLDAIFAFAELERFIDVPIKFYSAGMALRLGFAIASHLEPEILLIDEAFAVGDTAFRDRCLGRMLAFKAAGTTMVLVSHERYLVEQLCDTALLLDHGRVVALGRPEEAFAAYERVIEAEEGSDADEREGEPTRSPLDIEAVEVLGGEGTAEPLFRDDTGLTVRLHLRARRDIAGASVGVQIAREWHVLHGTRCNRQGIEITAHAGERVTLEVQYRPLTLARGSYALHVLIYEHRLAVEPVVVWKRAARFRVALPEKEGVGLVRIAHEWRVAPDGRSAGR